MYKRQVTVSYQKLTTTFTVTVTGTGKTTSDQNTQKKAVCLKWKKVANADGYVEYPNVDTVTEMTNLIDSSRSYEASATAFNAAKNIAAKGLELFNS